MLFQGDQLYSHGNYIRNLNNTEKNELMVYKKAINEFQEVAFMFLNCCIIFFSKILFPIIMVILFFYDFMVFYFFHKYFKAIFDKIDLC